MNGMDINDCLLFQEESSFCFVALFFRSMAKHPYGGVRHLIVM